VVYAPYVASYSQDYLASMLLYGCCYGLDYVVLLWSELCVCLFLLYDTSMGHHTVTWYFEREFVTSNDKPRIVAYRYIIEASIDVS
jgi:hypothetical protein